MQFVILLAIVFLVVVLCLAGIGIKMLVQRRGEFKRHCSSMDPYTGKRNGCACAAAEALCDNRKRHPYQPLEVNDELLKEAGRQ